MVRPCNRIHLEIFLCQYFFNHFSLCNSFSKKQTTKKRVQFVIQNQSLLQGVDRIFRQIVNSSFVDLMHASLITTFSYPLFMFSNEKKSKIKIEKKRLTRHNCLIHNYGQCFFFFLQQIHIREILFLFEIDSCQLCTC